MLSHSIFSQGIEFFHGKWQEALAKAKAEDKILFVDSYAEWCGPCKSMAKNVFTDSKVGEFFNSNFINLKLDMEKEDGVSFGHKYPVSAYPTLFFLSGEGKVVKTVKGGQRVDGLLALAKEALKNNDQSGKFEELYNQGDRSFDLVYKYVKALNAAGKPSLKISNDYLNSKPNITQDQKLTFYAEAAVDADSKLFDVLVDEKDAIITLIGQKEYNDKCQAALNVGLNKAIEFEVEPMLNKLSEKAISTLGKKEGEKWSLKAAMAFYKAFNNKDMYASAYKNYAKRSAEESEVLKFIYKDILKNFKTEKSMISDAAIFAEKAYEIAPTTEILADMINLLIENKEYKQAEKILKAELEKAEKAKQDVSFYKTLLEYVISKKA
jgi:thiol-disulfide isomerase/thioredoxin